MNNKAGVFYYEGNPILTDRDFDKKYGDIYYEESSNFNFKHKIPITSLRKVYDLKSLLEKFNFDMTDVIIQPKFDGMAIVVYYENSIPTAVVSRGSSLEGELIPIQTYFPKIEGLKNHVLFGEAIVKNDVDVGTLKRSYVVGKLKSKVINLDNISFIFYEILDLDKMESNLSLLESLSDKLEISPYFRYENNLDLDDIFYKFSLVYPIDGLVFRKAYVSNSFNIGTANPLYKFALKNEKFFANEETEVLRVNWEISKIGNYIPTLELKPVILEGTKVSRVLAYNYLFVVTNKLGKGSKVVISKRGHIIPYISEVLEEGRVEYPTECYYCGTNLVQIGVHLSCPNKKCSGRFEKIYFLFLKSLNVKPFGYSLYKDFFNPSFSYFDYLFLDEKNLHLNKKNYKKFINSLKEQRTKLTLPTLFSAFQIEGCSLKYFEDLFSRHSVDEILSGKVVLADSFRDFLKEFGLEVRKILGILYKKEVKDDAKSWSNY